MEILLKGLHALVGGSTRGLGKAIAMQLAASGATVTLMARNEEKLKAVVKELPTFGGQQHQYLVIDFAVFDQCKPVLENYFLNNSIDILVNNTNGPAAGTVLQKTVEDYQQSFDLLFKNVAFITMLALSGMRSRGYGRIINLSSVSVKEPLQNLVLSNTIRSAVIAWAKTLAREVASAGITVNNILTGYFNTERLDEIHTMQAIANGSTIADHKEKMKAEVPAGRFGKPEEFGYLVAFLASDKAAYITGINLPIDGGILKSV